MSDPPVQLGMFDDPLERRPPKVPASPPPGKPKWARVTSKTRIRCDDCTDIVNATKGRGPRSLQSKFRRITPYGDLLLCAPHAEDRKLIDDGPPPPKDTP